MGKSGDDRSSQMKPKKQLDDLERRVAEIQVRWRPRFSARGVVVTYALVAAAWIAFSDRVAASLAPGEDALATISTLKGWAFVVVTSALLAVMISGVGTERKRTEAHLSRLNRVLRTLSQAHEALVRASEETALLRAFCDAIVEQGAFLGAWVGYREDDPAGKIRPVVWAGPLEDYLASIALSWRFGEEGSRGPAGTSIRDGRTVVVRDAATDTTVAWRSEMLARGFRSVVALPLTIDDVAFGTLVIYARDPDPFGHDEMALLEQLASNLAYGVGTLRTREDAARGEAERLRLAVAVEQSADAVIITDATGAIEYVNPAFEQVSGYASAEVLGLNPRILKSGLHAPAFYAAMWTALSSGSTFVADLTNRRKDGSLFQEEAVISPIRDQAGTITSYVAVNRDVTNERASEAARDRISRERALIAGTLAGLQVFPTPEATAEAICRQVASLAGVATAGLSYFTLEGPAMPLAFVRPDGGSGPLLRIPFQRSRILRERAGEGPWVEAWGGHSWHPYDQLFGELGVGAITFVPVRYAGQLIGIMVVTSAVVDAVAQLTESLPAILEFAGFAGALVGPALADLTEIGSARDRISEIIKSAAFTPVFQPVVDIATGERVGFEALTRFSSGTAPDLVFADSRAAGVEADLEVATLAASIAAADLLPAAAWLGLNVSPNLVTSDGRLADLLGRSERSIVLEVTEHAPVRDYDELRTAIGRLRPGVRVAIDDAGAGVANFSHIVELRPAFVKLDIGLVRAVDSDLTRQALIVGLLHFARELHIQTIAEGVETEAELATLRALGVPLAQGYLLGRPAAVDEWADRGQR
jgi:PAS domain S-box-containing protein